MPTETALAFQQRTLTEHRKRLRLEQWALHMEKHPVHRIAIEQTIAYFERQIARHEAHIAALEARDARTS